jgi:HK97 family phage major capsid protein
MEKQDLIAERARLLNEAEAILTKARDENRFDLTGDENKKWEDLHAEADKRKAFIDKLETHEKLAEGTGRRSEPADPTRGNKPGGHGTSTRVTDTERSEALRSWMLAGAPDEPITDRQRETAKRCGLDLGAKRMVLHLGPALKANGWRGGLPAPTEDDLRAWQQAHSEQRAALTGAQSTTTTGGYTVADELMRSLEVALLAFGGVRSVATVWRTATGGPLPVPMSNDTSNKGEIIAENTTQNELEMTFTQLVLDAYKYTSKYILASVEFLQDSSINVNEFLGQALANRIGRITNDHFTTGDASSKPNGIVTASASGVTSVADPPTYDNFVDLVHSVDPSYRVNARFMMNDATLKTIKKIKVLQYSGDTTGVPLWSPSLVGGQPDTILGYPFVVNQSMASPGSSAKKVIFGDLSKYIVRDVRDFTLLRLDERFAELGQVAFLAFSRHDGDLLNAGTNPVKYMSQA